MPTSSRALAIGRAPIPSSVFWRPAESRCAGQRMLVVEKRREHSRKPDCVRERIERLVAGPYLELFARETKPGWDCWGNQLALFDHDHVPTRRQPSSLVDALEAAFSNPGTRQQD